MTAIFDIGKTNKKLFVFNDDLKIVYEKSQQFVEIKDEDGFPCEDLQALTDWMKISLDELLSNPSFEIKNLNFSAYGASFVHLGRDGKPVTPLFNYLKSFPEKLKEKFYQNHGSPELIAQETASPTLGHLNSGMQLYWLKCERPDVFKKIAVSLHLPQYLSSVFTGHYLSDITSIGCHTQLWDFEKDQYHNWVIKEKLDQVLAPISHSDLLVPAAKYPTIDCGIGLHDSSAALIPYLKNFSEPFILISTGTWCISLNPFNNEPLTKDELNQDCLCYLTYQGNPVKASRLFSGHEHDVQTKRLTDHFGKSENYYSTVKFDSALLSKGYDAENLKAYASFEEAYHALVKSLVKSQIQSTQLIMGNKPLQSLFVDGGFSKNEIFMNLLAKGFPDQKVYSSEIAQASALGAALVINPELEKSLSKNFTLRQFHPN